MQHYGKLPGLRRAYCDQQSRRTFIVEVKHVTQFSKNGTRQYKLLTQKSLTRPISCPTRDAVNDGVRTMTELADLRNVTGRYGAIWVS
jgi:hypothetical protein